MLKKNINVKMTFSFTASEGLLEKEVRFRQLTNYDGRKIGHIAKRAAAQTILRAFERRFQTQQHLGLPQRMARGKYGQKTTRKRQESDRRRRLSTIIEKLNEAYASGSTSRIRAAEKARKKATDKLRGGIAHPDTDLRETGGLFSAFVKAARKFPKQRKLVMDILRSEKGIKIDNAKGKIHLGIGDITKLDRINMPSASHELGQFSETPFVHMWRQMEFGSGVFADQQLVPGNLAGTIRGAWWYGPGAKAGVEFAGSKAGHIIFQAASVPYNEDAQAFFQKFSDLLVEAIGV